MFKHLNVAKFKRGRSGVSTLPTMLLLGGIIIEIAIAGAFLTYYFNVTNLGARLSAEALAAARAGADDALIQVVRNRTFSPDPNPYELTLTSGRTASVYICGEACTGVSGKTQVVSTATALNKKSRVEMTLIVTSEGKVTVDSLKEVPLL